MESQIEIHAHDVQNHVLPLIIYAHYSFLSSSLLVFSFKWRELYSLCQVFCILEVLSCSRVTTKKRGCHAIWTQICTSQCHHKGEDVIPSILTTIKILLRHIEPQLSSDFNKFDPYGFVVPLKPPLHQSISLLVKG